VFGSAIYAHSFGLSGFSVAHGSVEKAGNFGQNTFIEWTKLQVFSPTIAREIEALETSMNIPKLRFFAAVRTCASIFE
jgi:hypothetical protein